MRINGFQRPFHPLQILSWVVFGLDVLVFCVFGVPLVDTVAAKVIVAVCYTTSVGVLVLAAIKATSCDPADAHVRCQGMHLKNDPCADMPYCTMCSVPVYPQSKHCRACNKCVNVFDHHCMWLNNCIGERNYRPFLGCICSVAVMTGIVLGTCGYLFVDYFVNEEEFVVRLHQNPLFSEAPREVAMGLLCCLTVVNFPLFTLDMQLVVLHAFLYTQGLTTYEYIMNKRDLQLDDEFNAEAEQPEKPQRARTDYVRKKIQTLPRCMDWIVFRPRKRRENKNKIEKIDPMDDSQPAEGKVAPDPVGLKTEVQREAFQDCQTPSPPGSNPDVVAGELGVEDDLEIGSQGENAQAVDEGKDAACADTTCSTASTHHDNLQKDVGKLICLRSPRSAQEEREIREDYEEASVSAPAGTSEANDAQGAIVCLGCGTMSDCTPSAPPAGSKV